MSLASWGGLLIDSEAGTVQVVVDDLCQSQSHWGFIKLVEGLNLSPI